jgi:epoxide hydrolase 4
MLNWYRAAFRRSLKNGLSLRRRPARGVHVPTLMLWGKNDIALSHEMAQPSIDLCDNGRLEFFENATHWVQHDEAETVSQALVEFFQPA